MERLTKEQLSELAQFDTPTICNALETFGIRKNTEGYMAPGMELRTADLSPVVGYAATAKVSGDAPAPDGPDNLMAYYAHVREMDDPTIAVVQDIDPVALSSFWGEVQATVHKALGCVATITDGGVRDINDVNRVGFHFFSTAVTVAHGYTHVERWNCPVRILGLTVLPGDLLHADRHGVTKIPHEVAPKLAAACRKIVAAEYPMLEPCRQAIREGRKPTIAELSQWQNAMSEARKKESV